jgi:hypothetical protein
MREEERSEPAVTGREPARAIAARAGGPAHWKGRTASEGWVIETVVSPFHCLYADALDLHTQSRLRVVHSEADASRLARASILLYLAAAEALVQQAVIEIARPELAHLVHDPTATRSLSDLCRLLPLLMGEPPRGNEASAAPWPQFAELIALRESWTHPGPAHERRAYYFRPADRPEVFEPLDPHEIPSIPGALVTPEDLVFPLTGLPRDPYALRPHHVDTARAVLDAAIEALDRQVRGALTRDRRHRSEPVRVISQPADKKD